MLTWFKNKFGKKNDLNKRLQDLENKIAVVTESLQRTENELTEVTVSKEQLEQEVSIFRQQEELNQQRYDSDEPWIEITSDDYNSDKGLKIGLDWNKAFITYLKQHNITGITEEDAIRKYLAYLYQDIIIGLEQQSIDQSDKKEKISDFA